MWIRSVILAVVLSWAALPALSASSADEARSWIKRMNEAVVKRNYDGMLEHKWVGGGSETLRIIHRMQDGHMSERLLFMGSKYEITRDGTKYVEYDLRKGVAKGQTLTRSYGYLPAFNGISLESDKFYVIRNDGPQRLTDYAGQTQLITVQPLDQLRYGYRFWLDPVSAMPIKTQLLAANGVLIDEIFFQALSMPDVIRDDLLKPSLSAKEAKALVWVKPLASSTVVKRAFVPQPGSLPPGFSILNVNAADTKRSASEPETRFLISDGVNWVSVVVSVADRKGRKEGLQRESASAFSYLLEVEGHYISVGGEVPPATVQAIAKAFQPE